jgi:hypothetical protein
MTQGNCATVRIQSLFIDSQLLHYGEILSGEGFV